jgi:hypothetical protein
MNAQTIIQSSNRATDGALVRQRETDLLMCSMPEISCPTAHACRLPGDGRRLNLVIPVLSEKLSFAGMQTAQRLFRSLLEHFEFARIIVTAQAFEPSALEHWPEWTVGDREFSPKSIVFLERKDDPGISVAEHDFFIATGWAPAMFIERVRAQQRELLRSEPHRYLYFIQDYEPLLYPASPQYCLAEASYNNRDDMIAVFNTKALSDYFAIRGLTFRDSFIHEPMLHPTLEALRAAHYGVFKERVIFVYARPTFQRNGFRLLIEGLKHWARTYPAASQWSVVSAGGKHPDLYLPDGSAIRALHKLTLEDYGALLSRAWIGLSLSFTAHPGQVPQEIAEFGGWSITNACETRKPAAIAPNMIPLAELSPSGIAAALTSCCSQFQPGRTSVLDAEHRIFRPSGSEFEFIDALTSKWQ